ncbi:MAG: hypothetical protein FI685_00450 [SAR202 cluster bacterium]|jgi:hypothetical protein|nr:maleylpyruvate isomerase N-terminal domain-containing protein [SAR202 cluster bacterium]MQG46546.1 hypothetical protein [SAR202 cluster bacterium]|tara:strand:- start:98 stop:835 length:738 start_codon:yes stop_codon:yes gene_type:complete
MTRDPLKRQITWKLIKDEILSERKILASFCDSFTDKQWTTDSLCKGWTVGIVVNHVMIADRFPSSFGWKVILKVLAQSVRGFPPNILISWQEQMALDGPKAAASKLRNNPLPFTARYAGKLGALLNFVEEVIHVEDVIRPLSISRARPPCEILIKESLNKIAPWIFWYKTLYGKTTFRDTSGDHILTINCKRWMFTTSSKDFNSDAEIIGQPIDLLLHLFGRNVPVMIPKKGSLSEKIRNLVEHR